MNFFVTFALICALTCAHPSTIRARRPLLPTSALRQSPSLSRRTRTAPREGRRFLPYARNDRNTDPEILNQVKTALQQAGFDETMARTSLENWKKMGLNNTDDVKGKLVQETLRGLGIRAGWIGINSYLTYQTYLASVAFSQQDNWLQWPAKFFTYLNAFSLTQEVLLFALMSYSLFQFSRNPVLLNAVQELAGKNAEMPALEVKPMKIVDGLKVFNTLQELNKNLKSMELEASPLDTLSSMLTLQQNSDVDAGTPSLDNAVKIFNRYDVNNDQVLDGEELQMMLRDSGLKLEDAEIKEAVKILDATNNDGRVDFKEFIAFWSNKLRRPQQKQQSDPNRVAQASE